MKLNFIPGAYFTCAKSSIGYNHVKKNIFTQVKILVKPPLMIKLRPIDKIQVRLQRRKMHFKSFSPFYRYIETNQLIWGILESR